MSAAPGDITRLLAEAASGNQKATEELWPIVYHELRRMARSQLSRERAGGTLQPTALVNEAYLRLTKGGSPKLECRAHFFAAAAEAMRRILIEQARRRSTHKRGDGLRPLPIESVQLAADSESVELLALDHALQRLEQHDPDRAQVVKLRFFAGLTEKETAEALGISVRTATRLWTGARVWLHREIAEGPLRSSPAS
jgi:RNA polymerase sigma factor (TIGR02999 family)